MPRRIGSRATQIPPKTKTAAMRLNRMPPWRMLPVRETIGVGKINLL
jgi:hypothetical protein